MTTLETLNRWLADAPEDEHLEFKEAKQQYDATKLLRYCVALANEGGGHLVLGVSDKRPRQVVGTQAFQNRGEITARILEALRMRVDVQELEHPDGRVLVFAVPPRPAGTPLHHEGAYLMRAGEDLVPMSPDQLKRIFAEGGPDWFDRPARAGAGPDDVVALLDTQSFFDLMQLPYPTSRDGVLERLAQERLIERKADGWNITNLAAILLAKRLDAFSPELARKAPRVVIYEGVNKLATRYDEPEHQGYAVGFEKLVDFVHSSAPRNHFVEQALRDEVKMFPRQAIRELVANALVHQSFEAPGSPSWWRCTPIAWRCPTRGCHPSRWSGSLMSSARAMSAWQSCCAACGCAKKRAAASTRWSIWQRYFNCLHRIFAPAKRARRRFCLRTRTLPK